MARGWAMEFAVTNVGTGTAIYNQTGSIDVSGKRSVLAVPCKSKLRRFAPGAGDIIRAEIPQEWMGRLRFTGYYTRENLRTQLQDWQLRVGVPPARVEWVMAHLLMEVEFYDTAVSEWIDR